jgi:hypothetical protein
MPKSRRTAALKIDDTERKDRMTFEERNQVKDRQKGVNL